MRRLLQVLDAFDHGIVEGGLATGWKSREADFNLRGALRERQRPWKTVADVFVEHDGEDLVFRMARRGERFRASEHHRPPGDHAAAVIDDQANGDRYVYVAEEGNLLRLIVFGDLKDLLGKIRNSIRASVEHVDMQNDQFGYALEDRHGRIVLTRRSGEYRQHREQQQGRTGQRFHRRLLMLRSSYDKRRDTNRAVPDFNRRPERSPTPPVERLAAEQSQTGGAGQRQQPEQAAEHERARGARQLVSLTAGSDRARLRLRLAGGDAALLDDRVGRRSGLGDRDWSWCRLRYCDWSWCRFRYCDWLTRRFGGRRARLSDLHVGDTALEHAVTPDFYAGARSNPLRLVFRVDKLFPDLLAREVPV